jgi:hypothetical protein
MNWKKAHEHVTTLCVLSIVFLGGLLWFGRLLVESGHGDSKAGFWLLPYALGAVALTWVIGLITQKMQSDEKKQ